MYKFFFFLIPFISILQVMHAQSQQELELQTQIQQQQQQAVQNPALHELQRNVLLAQQTGEDWIKKVDAGDYAGSWSTGALFLQLTFTQSQWQELMTILRKPMGSVKDRELIDMRLATNPPNTPPGDYMVMLYQTSFSNGQTAKELLTLQEYQGAWKVYTYLLAADKPGNPFKRP